MVDCIRNNTDIKERNFAMCRPYVSHKHPEEIKGAEATESVMKTPLISVIVPIYNASPYLEKSMGSLCAQSHENLEIIAVDDGSSDDSFKVLKEMALQDKIANTLALWKPSLRFCPAKRMRMEIL